MLDNHKNKRRELLIAQLTCSIAGAEKRNSSQEREFLQNKSDKRVKS